MLHFFDRHVLTMSHMLQRRSEYFFYMDGSVRANLLPLPAVLPTVTAH
jgi:hypothetical protein